MAQARRLLLRGVSQALTAARTSYVPASFTITRSFTDSKLFVGGLSFRTTEDSLKGAFAVHGEICDARIITDRETGRSRGFGFVTYYNESDAENALSKLNGQILDGRTIRVDRASARPPAGGRAGMGSTFPSLTDIPEPPQDEDWGTIPSLNADIPGANSSSTDASFGGDDDFKLDSPSTGGSFGGGDDFKL